MATNTFVLILWLWIPWNHDPATHHTVWLEYDSRDRCERLREYLIRNIEDNYPTGTRTNGWCVPSENAPIDQCGTFDVDLLGQDLKADYFDRGGTELAKATLTILAEHVKCKKRMGDSLK